MVEAFPSFRNQFPSSELMMRRRRGCTSRWLTHIDLYLVLYSITTTLEPKRIPGVARTKSETFNCDVV